MFVSIMSAALCGVESYPVRVEVDTSQGLPGFDMVGSLSGQVKEARERVRAALRNAKVRIPPVRITVNLSPADRNKDGTAFDLPIAIGIIASLSLIEEEAVREVLFLGELGLNGELKGVNGVLPILLESRNRGITECVIPQQNGMEAHAVTGMQIFPACDMKEVLEYLGSSKEKRREYCEKKKKPKITLYMEETRDNKNPEPDFSDLSGQPVLKRAAEIAAAGFHHLLLVGPPGSGKTMLAARMPGILPELSYEERLEVSKIYSVAGTLPENGIIKQRPFYAAHHSISVQALLGGGRIPKPGAISLAHHGILFLDEFPEFHRDAIESLREPLEEKKIKIARSNATYHYPADFMLVAAMNPCPCGYYPDRNRCKCTPNEVKRYLARISGPILDRMDLCVETPKVEIGDLQEQKKGESSMDIRKRVEAALERQRRRYAGTDIRFNSQLSVAQIKEYCPLGNREQAMLANLFESLSLSARSYHRLIRLSRTIADLDESEHIKEKHLAQAACYRVMERYHKEDE